MGRIKLVGKLEDKYRDFIEKEHLDLEFVSAERELEHNSYNTYRYYITTRCKHCGVLKTNLALSYKKKTTCKCRDIEALKESAKEYAFVLYNTLAQDELGLIAGQDLDDYIEACAKYDRPTFCQFKDFMKLLKEEVSELYKVNMVKECNMCGIILPYRNMHAKNRNLCKSCYKEMRRNDRTRKCSS